MTNQCGAGIIYCMAKKTSKKAVVAIIPTGSRAAQWASLTAEMLKLGILKMEEGGDPHWLAQYFFKRCENAWENYKTEHKPNWSVSTTEIVEVAVSLMRNSLRPKNGFEHCNLPKGQLPEMAIQWIAGAHHALCVMEELEGQKKERETLLELRDYWNTDLSKKSMIPISVVLKLAGCDELKLTAKELASLGQTEVTFKALSATDKHRARLSILSRYEVLMDIHPYAGKKPERMGAPVKIKPALGEIENGRCELGLLLAEKILAMRKAKEQRIREVRTEARTKNKVDSRAPVGTKKTSKAQESI